MTPRDLTEAQRDELRRIMGGSPLMDRAGRSVALLDVEAIDLARFPVRESIALSTADLAKVVEDARRAIGQAGYVVTIAVHPGDAELSGVLQHRAAEGKVVGETAPLRDDRRFRRVAGAALSLLVIGIAVGTTGWVLGHSGLWAFLGYAGFILPAFVVLVAFGTTYASDVVAVVLTPTGPQAVGPQPAGSVGTARLEIVAGRVRSRERATRSRTRRAIVEVRLAPSTRADLERILELTLSPSPDALTSEEGPSRRGFGP